MATIAFDVESMIRGYHEYIHIWESPSTGESLVCEREIGNSHDTHAVAIKKDIDGEIKTVGHIPRKISVICSIFIRRGGSILCLVNGARRYSSDLPQGGLEIPCVLKFAARNEKEAAKTKRLLESALNILIPSEGGNRSNTSYSENSAPSSSSSNVDDDLNMLTDRAVLNKENNVMELTVDLTENCSVDSPPAKKQKVFDVEKIIMGEELTDAEIHYAQRLLKAKHPMVNGLRTTLYTGKLPEIENSIQIVHCPKRFHWITVTTINCKAGEVRVFDSTFTYCDKETVAIIHNLYQRDSEKLTITMCRCQKQRGGKDCGLFSIAFAVALVFNLSLSKLKFHQERMRTHLVDCFTKQVMMPFPCK